LQDCKHIAIITGEDLAVESGIHTILGDPERLEQRSYGGEKDVTKIMTNLFYRHCPEAFWEWNFDMLDKVRNAQPNAGHYAIENFLAWTRQQSSD
jgi:NAD-dependent SIR2 family protein deacetylase